MKKNVLVYCSGQGLEKHDTRGDSHCYTKCLIIAWNSRWCYKGVPAKSHQIWWHASCGTDAHYVGAHTIFHIPKEQRWIREGGLDEPCSSPGAETTSQPEYKHVQSFTSMANIRLPGGENSSDFCARTHLRLLKKCGWSVTCQFGWISISFKLGFRYFQKLPIELCNHIQGACRHSAVWWGMPPPLMIGCPLWQLLEGKLRWVQTWMPSFLLNSTAENWAGKNFHTLRLPSVS